MSAPVPGSHEAEVIAAYLAALADRLDAMPADEKHAEVADTIEDELAWLLRNEVDELRGRAE